jgi:hypothetical protein
MFLFSISALFGSSKVRVISTSTLFLTIFMFYILAIQRGEFFNSQSTFTNIILSFLFINIQHEALSVSNEHRDNKQNDSANFAPQRSEIIICRVS